MAFEILLIVMILAFILEFLDASAGMGYGTMTPILLLMGFQPLEVVSAVILTSAILSLITGYLHHDFKNVNLSNKKNIKILSILISFGIISIVIAALIAINISSFILKAYIGFLIIIIGFSILLKKKKKYKFSWKRLMIFGSLASFNKGISGAGFGPVLAGGQIISGVKSKHAVGITALTEGVVSTFGFLTYLIINGPNHMNWPLIISLSIGGLISTPIAVYFVNRFHPKKFKYFIAITSIILGIAIIVRLFFL